MKPIIIDTNAFLRFLLNDVSHQKEEFEKLIKSVKKHSEVLVVPQIVIFEIDFTLEKYYGFSKAEVIDKLESLISAPYFKVQNEIVFKIALSIYRINNVSFVDSFTLAYTKEKNGKLFTFDQDLKKLSKK